MWIKFKTTLLQCDRGGRAGDNSRLGAVTKKTASFSDAVLIVIVLLKTGLALIGLLQPLQ